MNYGITTVGKETEKTIRYFINWSPLAVADRWEINAKVPAVAGVLGALYFYVLRREKELDEYEQLLFSEDFNDDVLDPVDEPAQEDAKA